MSAPAVSDLVAGTCRRDLRREAEPLRLAHVARKGIDGVWTRPARVVVAVAGWATGTVARLFRSRSNPVGVTHRRPAERLERDALPHLDRLYCLALLMTGDPGGAEDLVEATFTAAYASLQPQAGVDPKAWLYRILVTGHRRRRLLERSPVAAADQTDRPPIDAVPHPVSIVGPAPIEALRRVSDRDVKHALHHLPDDARIMVYLADVEGYSYAEIADITDMPISTVTARLHRGRRQLGNRLQAYATTPAPGPR